MYQRLEQSYEPVPVAELEMKVSGTPPYVTPVAWQLLFVTNSASAPTTSMRIGLFGTVTANVSEETPAVAAVATVTAVSTRIGLDVTDVLLPTLSVPVSVYT